MSIGLIFDLDLTLIDSKVAEPYRKQRQWQRVYEVIPSFSPYNGIAEVLDFVARENISYCIVTSSPNAYCVKVCQQWGINSELCVCYHDTARRKPYPDPIHLALQKLKLPASNVLSFGDRDIDITASNAAGVSSVACLWGAGNHESLLAAHPVHTIQQPNEMIDLITQFNIAVNE